MSLFFSHAALRTILFSILMGCAPVLTNTARSDEFGETQERVLIEAAVASVVDSIQTTDIREMFAYHLRLRGVAVPGADRAKYWLELKAKPELRNTPIHGPESELSQTVAKKLKPVFILFKRDWDVAIIEQDAPFSGAFRQSIYIVSTGLLGLITDEELRSFAAHELAHECFINELREADRTGCLRAYHLVEFKSDLVATLACLLLKDNPLSIAYGITRIEAYYLNVDPSVLQDNKHPKAQHRRCCVEKFLARIRHGTSTA